MMSLRWANRKTLLIIISIFSLMKGAAMAAEPVTTAEITIDLGEKGRSVSPRLWGVFFEDINHSFDGGIYAEMVSNRGFESATVPPRCAIIDGHLITPGGYTIPYPFLGSKDPLVGWTAVAEGDAQASLSLDTARPLSVATPHSARLDVSAVSKGRAGLANEGFWGMAIRKGARYELSFYVRAAEGFAGSVTATLESADGRVYARERFGGAAQHWQQFKCTLASDGDDRKARLVLTIDQPGTVWLDMVSLFPEETYKGRVNGMRPDLVAMLEGLKPAFMRFPGGCIVEGCSIDTAWRWKNTIGDLADRPSRFNLWGYTATDGFGYHEMLQLAEDLGSESMPIFNCGMSCQGRHPEFIHMDLLDEWVQEALDGIEYANGPIDSKWGAVRAANGHPEPFNVRLVGIGNENSGPEYEERYAVFYKAFKERYPEIETIACADVKSAPIDIIDHHYYATPDWFMAHADLYDDADRQGPKIFVGEYAANQNAGKGNLAAALSEAAFMAGLERNGDIIDMAAYAPLFQHEEDRAWPVNLIVFNNSEVYGLPSYHVQKMFAENHVDRIQPLTIDAPVRPVEVLEQGTIGLGTWATRAEFRDIVVSSGDKTFYETSAEKAPAGWRFLKGDWRLDGSVITNAEAPSDNPLTLALAGAADWTDYRLRLKACKVSGDEGFLIAFRAGDERNLFWWNLGGWGNASHGLERTVNGSKSRIGNGVTGRIETDRWYDIRIDVTGQRIQCWLDGELIHDVENEVKPIPTMVAVAGRDEASGQWVVKVVNYSGQTRSTKLTLENAGVGSFTGEAITLASDSLLDENTFEEPEKVSAQSRPFGPVAATFDYEFPPYSLTILRLGR